MMERKRTGSHALFEQLLADDIEFVFGNPGTVEEELLDTLTEFARPRYILALQETVAVAMADGYARAGRRPAVALLHSGVGLGNGIGMLYQAMRGQSPLVVLAGEAGLQYEAMEAQMAADLVRMASPVTKWATRVVDRSSVLRVLRRAIKVARTPPMGPVFVGLPMDVLDAENDEPVVPTTVVATRTMPEPSLVRQAAEMLASASMPLIIVGDGVAVSSAQPELTRLAEQIGAEVWGANSSEVNMSARHPQFCGLLGHMFGAESRAITSRADVVLICGTYVFPEVFPATAGVFAPGAKVLHIDLDPSQIAKNFPVDLAFLSDPKATLSVLATALNSEMTPSAARAAKERATRMKEAQDRGIATELAAYRSTRDEVPIRASRLMEALARELPQDAMIFDEALTCSPQLCRYLPPTEPGTYYQTRGGSLGVGIPGALGMKLCYPKRTVVGVTGDGGAMYTIQALWTAAHHGIDAKFVICNNRSYELLKLNLEDYWRERGLSGRDFPSSFDLRCPDIRFDELARSMGIGGARVERPEDLAPVLRLAFETKGPFLVDAVVGGAVQRTARVPCGQ